MKTTPSHSAAIGEMDAGVLAQLYDPMPSWPRGVAMICGILIAGLFHW